MTTFGENTTNTAGAPRLNITQTDLADYRVCGRLIKSFEAEDREEKEMERTIRPITARGAERIAGIRRAIASDIEALEVERALIETEIKKLSGMEYEVVYWHYIKGETFSQIAERIHYSERTVLRYHEKAKGKLSQDPH